MEVNLTKPDSVENEKEEMEVMSSHVDHVDEIFDSLDENDQVNEENVKSELEKEKYEGYTNEKYINEKKSELLSLNASENVIKEIVSQIKSGILLSIKYRDIDLYINAAYTYAQREFIKNCLFEGLSSEIIQSELFEEGKPQEIVGMKTKKTLLLQNSNVIDVVKAPLRLFEVTITDHQRRLDQLALEFVKEQEKSEKIINEKNEITNILNASKEENNKLNEIISKLQQANEKYKKGKITKEEIEKIIEERATEKFNDYKKTEEERLLREEEIKKATEQEILKKYGIDPNKPKGNASENEKQIVFVQQPPKRKLFGRKTKEQVQLVEQPKVEQPKNEPLLATEEPKTEKPKAETSKTDTQKKEENINIDKMTLEEVIMKSTLTADQMYHMRFGIENNVPDEALKELLKKNLPGTQMGQLIGIYIARAKKQQSKNDINKEEIKDIENDEDFNDEDRYFG